MVITNEKIIIKYVILFICVKGKNFEKNVSDNPSKNPDIARDSFDIFLNCPTIQLIITHIYVIGNN